MKSALVLAAVIGLAGTGVVAPASAVAPAKKKPGGTVIVTVGNGCSAKLVGPGKQKSSRKIPASGVLKGVAPGTYTLQVKPKSTCKPQPSKVKVKKGKRVTAEVLSDPKLVSTSLTGSFSGTETGPGALASWSGEITLTLSSVGSASFASFPQLAQYRVTAASGSWSMSGAVPGGCSYSGGGPLTLDDFAVTSGNYWVNPWNNYMYAFEGVSNTDKSWPYVATCPEGEGFEQRNETRGLPFRLLSTNQWSGIDPVAPLPTGVNPSGTFTWQQGSSSTTWTWALDTDLGKEYSKP